MVNSVTENHLGILATLGHRRVHPFPARMAPAIAWNEINKLPAGRKILDPMSGSGTTIAIARASGHKAYGFDTDPLAVLISNVWCANVRDQEVIHEAEQVLARARRRQSTLPLRSAYPFGADDATKSFIRYWFDSVNRRQLAALSLSIAKVKNEKIAAILWCAFSRLIITKRAGASLAMDVSHSRPHRVFDRAPIRPFDKYLSAVERVLNAMPFKDGLQSLPQAKIIHGDARHLPLEAQSVDLVVTSPPYLNAIDYLRGHKLSLVWMGFALTAIRRIRSSNVGSEASTVDSSNSKHLNRALSRMGATVTLKARLKNLLLQYLYDMDKVLSEVNRVLKPSGSAVFVVGDSMLSNIFISNSNALSYLGRKNGLRVVTKESRPLPDNRRYLPPPSRRSSGKEMSRRMKEEVIVTFRKEISSIPNFRLHRDPA